MIPQSFPMVYKKRYVCRRSEAILFVGLVFLAASLSAADFYVSPSASGSGTGSFSSPWQLQVALSQPGSVHPGDTIWLRGGTYSGTFTGYLVGTSSSPIIVRQYAGERAIIDGGNSNGNAIFVIAGSYTWYWGFEVMSSDPIRSTTISGSSPPGSAMPRGEGILIGQGTPHPGLKFINMIIHDARQGISFWKDAQDSEIYGCLIYYNGWQAPDRGHGHGIYAQNQTGTKKITDNILFSGFAYGIHAYGSGTAYLDNIDIEGTTTFNAGNLYADGSNLLLGGESGNVAQNPILKNNYLYRSSGGSADFDLGYSGGCTNATVTNNYISNSTILASCAPTSMTSDTFYGSIDGFTQSQYPSNTYYSSRPSGTQIFIRPNAYEAGRANITIYNWDLLGSVSIDLSGVLADGDSYEIRNAHDFFGAPVLTGTYTGASVSIPMTGLSVAAPVGWAAPPSTGPEFGAFVVTATLGPGEFYDVAPNDPFHDFIHTIAIDGITAGCGGGNYCPYDPVSRAQMAVFLLKSKYGASYAPPPASGTVFADVPQGAFAADWIEEIHAEGITAGCGGGDYCPDATVSRAEMAVFLIKAYLGPNYAPPPATGLVFSDVPAGAFAAGWIEELAALGITSGCGGGRFCPDSPSSRAEMAVFLTVTFNLP